MAQQLARLAEDVRELQREKSGLRSEQLIAAGQQIMAGKTGAPTSPAHVFTLRRTPAMHSPVISIV